MLHSPRLTLTQAYIGLAILLLVLILIAVAMFYWYHVTGVNTLHLLADGDLGPKTTGC